MKAFLAAIVLVSSLLAVNGESSSDEPWILMEDARGMLHLVNTRQSVHTSKVNENDVAFYLYTRSNKNNPNKLTVSNPGAVTGTAFNANKPTWFVSHGWNNDYQSPIGQTIKNALLDTIDVNVFVTDWGAIANDLNYPAVAGAVKEVGNFLGQFAAGVSKATGASPSSFHLAGHSLGAHVSGNAGQVLNGAARYIVGMDPAAPLIAFEEPDKRLDPTDGQTVEIIHTCAGSLGYKRAIGHADFYPNGGAGQPGCGADLACTCGHSRSYQYFAESVRGGKFTAYRCDSYDDFVAGNCRGQPTAKMGGIAMDPSASGVYYLDTRDKEPFAMG